MVVNALGLTSAAVLLGGKDKPVIAVSAWKPQSHKVNFLFINSYLPPTVSEWWKLH